MIKIENTEVVGWKSAIRGVRNPLNSWEKSDTIYLGNECRLGENDYSLMKSLTRAGTDHAKCMRMITVYCDITAPLYWWKEFDTYKVGTVSNSCSTMHSLHTRDLKLDDFSHEKLDTLSKRLLESIIITINDFRAEYIENKKKDDWYQMIQLLPSSYNQKRTIELNYQVLANMYSSRINHKLDEWLIFCEWIKTLPYSDLITIW